MWPSACFTVSSTFLLTIRHLLSLTPTWKCGAITIAEAHYAGQTAAASKVGPGSALLLLYNEGLQPIWLYWRCGLQKYSRPELPLLFVN